MKRRRFRDVITGRFVRRADALTHPDTTLGETVSDAPQVEANLRWRVTGLEAALIQTASRMEQLARALEHPEGERVAGVISSLRYEASRARSAYDAKIPEERA